LNDFFELKKNSRKKMSKYLVVISGGQTGADIAALKAAKLCGLETGGVAPADYITADGAKPELGTEFGLKQLMRAKESLSEMYVKRSKLNVEQGDVTISFRLQPSVGTDKTIGYCRDKNWAVARGKVPTKVYRPCLVINDVADEEKAGELVAEFLKKHAVLTVNVCGHRDDVTAGITQFEDRVFRILVIAFKKLKEEE
jgi:hypothetical protein